MARFLLFIAIVAVSTAAPLIRYAAPAPALTVAAVRMCLAGLLLSLIAPRAWRLFAALSRRERLYVATSGLLLGVHFGTWISSLYMTSTAASMALVATQPVFAAMFARALGDSITRREIAGIVVAGLGCVALGGGDLLSGSGLRALLGDALALAGAASAAGYLVVGRRMRVSLPLAPYLAMVNTIAGLALLIAALIVDSPFAGFAAHVYLAMALAAIVPSLVGHTLLNWSVRRSPTHLVALALLGEPIVASLLTWALFAERPPMHAILGGAVVLFGIFVGFARRRTPQNTGYAEQEDTGRLIDRKKDTNSQKK